MGKGCPIFSPPPRGFPVGSPMLYNVIVREVRYKTYQIVASNDDEAIVKYYDGKGVLAREEVDVEEVDDVAYADDGED